ncbi:HvfC/BufC family peptide modification chaperone [Bordetella genomosp. 12]|uniref:DUF2063 domain-containing protein n=1 Tax=Bordetella genomosp. 12 TaxID=463035 RepID=A0A261VD93_9BORD|nr:putative DNA-binding domain-containing protein [Bordetella genomosp. 12]OZI72104.1 DUF2063 domain-containing protein [Bordetella genomosp. 12]
MSAAFYDYVRGLSDQIPPGYSAAGMRVYRYLVYLGASQMVDASFPGLRDGLGESAWRVLIEEFVRQSAWTSPFYGDLQHEFRDFLARASA